MSPPPPPSHLPLMLVFALALAPAPSIAAPSQTAAASAAVAVSDSGFTRDVLPLLAARCVSCHGPEKRKGGLRLDNKADALAGGDDGPAFVAGKSASSAIMKRVRGEPSEDLMPPEGKGERLSAAEVTVLQRWIDAGAPWPDDAAAIAAAPAAPTHWAFRVPQRPPLPAVKDARWVRNPIDAFVLAGLEREGVRPSPPADRRTLIRRLHLDLTGLPPPAAEVAAFAESTAPGAYEALVDRLLASPHFGEQWARHWLDLARYADSDGYEKDLYRPHAWRWRDWVIDAINRDQPFDAFTRDQLAGDLLPNATLEQRVATGFLRNALLNREGGVDVEEDRTKIAVDRVSTVGTAWLGLTLGCAECHTHKYDPITQREFYQFYAFFNSLDDREIAAPLTRERDAGVPVSEGERALEAAKRAYAASPPAGLSAWAARVAALPDVWHTPAFEDYELPTFGANNGANLYLQEDGSFLATGMVEGKTHYVMMLNTRLRGGAGGGASGGITGIRVEAMADEMLPAFGPGHASDGGFTLTEVRLEGAPLKAVSDLRRHKLAAAFADHSQPGHPIAAAIDGDENAGGWAIGLAGLAPVGLDRAAVLTTAEDLALSPEGTRLKVTLVQHAGKARSLGRVRVSYTTAPRPTLAAHAVPERIKAIARTPSARRTLDEHVLLKRYHQATFDKDAPELLAFTAALASSPGIKGEVRAPVISERRIRRRTHVHVRGNFLDKGPAVEPGVVAAFHPFRPRAGTADRLDLSSWLVGADNPLTARVAANHVWRHLFGEGIVPTTGDFGTQGDRPSHPELLDWLATELVRGGFRRKALVRLIVTSAAYRQSSATRPELVERDAKNRWLGRQNRFRLTAENVRDQLLGGSGLLDRGVGGPSVKPSVPRRGMYLEIRRSNIEYMLTAFDAPGTTQACPKRERSNTPLQALVLMNDEMFVRAARALAGRTFAEAPARLRDRLTHAFVLATARPPAAADLRDIERLHATARAHYLRHGADAEALWGGGAIPAGASPADAAAMTVAARAVLNLDQVVTRE